MKKLFSLLLILASFHVFGECEYSKYNLNEIRASIDHYIQDSFFESIQGTQIKIKPYFSTNSFLKANGTLLKKKNKRILSIYLNPLIFEFDNLTYKEEIKFLKTLRKRKKRGLNKICPPSPRAIDAILVHEMSHLLDFKNKTTLGFAPWGISYTVSPAKTELQADIEVLHQFGLSCGLKEYRQWLYPIISNKDAKRKRKRYLTPRNIDDLISGQKTQSKKVNKYAKGLSFTSMDCH